MKQELEIITFCHNVKALREGKHLSQEDMATLLNLDVTDLTLIENGILPQDVTCNILFQIQKHFGIHPKDIFFKKL